MSTHVTSTIKTITGSSRTDRRGWTIETAQPRHVVILSEGAGFPHGMASSRRIELLARGLVSADHCATVLVVRPFEKEAAPLNTAARGTYRGVDFAYPCGTTIRSRHFAARRWNDWRGILGACGRLRQARRAGRLDAVILYSFSLNLVRIFSGVCRRLGVPLVQELCEWPLDQRAAHGAEVRGAVAFCAGVFGRVNAVLPISARIEEIAARSAGRTGRTIPALRIPILVDPEMFVSDPQCAAGDDLMYSGSPGYRNITGIVLDLGAELKRRGLRHGIQFSGRIGEGELEEFNAEVRRRGLEERVRHLGYLSDGDLIRTCQRAGALLVPLPDDPQSASRFPTRLGECLAVGRPVLTTAFGEAARWLRDGETAFVAADCKPETLADHTELIFSNPERAGQVGAAGRRLAEEEFDYRRHGRRLGEFVNGLCAR